MNDALKVTWQVDDLIGSEKSLDLSRCFLPESMVRSHQIDCLSAEEKLRLNQIRGNSYLHLFILVEQFVIPMVLEQMKAKGFSDIDCLQALLCFAEEEGKHIQLFQKFATQFQRKFATSCHCIDSISEITRTVLTYHPLSILLLTIQFKWTSQSHYLASIRDNEWQKLVLLGKIV